MNAGSRIKELVRAYLSNNHEFDGVQFIDHLLAFASEVGEIACSLAGEERLHFRIPGQPVCEVDLVRAKAKLRLLCARLGVLCQENGAQEVTVFGGEAFIKKHGPAEVHTNGGPVPSSVFHGGAAGGTSVASPAITKEWRVRFKNTPDEQEFTILSAAR
jgi:hypothetical protein